MSKGSSKNRDKEDEKVDVTFKNFFLKFNIQNF